MPIKKILIANRGEIACRVMRTCREMGIATVAVYSEADAHALHVEMADEAVLIGGAEARESYLVYQKIIDVAKAHGVDAIHPGYGFLSENEDFAEAVAAAGMIFIGPPVSAIRAMGGKSEAKALMEKAGVPLVPGYHGDQQDEAFLAKEADKIGYPVLIKASAGGGGKGMRVVEKAADFKEALAGAQREAQASFGDQHVLVEKYLARPRHVEIQVFADQAGNTVYLFERDCSIQRRHQKVLEEAPAPGLKPDVRAKMGAAAVAAAKAIGYTGAGTVEFLLDTDGSFYFMEMNTRLQVEHPVTEMITGLDLVAWQIRVAEGGNLTFTQEDLAIQGHAIEVRLYAEDPANNFLPGAGQIKFLRFPLESAAVRVDTGVRETTYETASGAGDVISIYYDPMIAKIIVHGASRAEAIERLRMALDETLVAGPKTNLVFLRALAAHPSFVAGDLTTQFISEHGTDLLPARARPADDVFALAALGLFIRRETNGAMHSEDVSPWNDLSGWRIGGVDTDMFVFKEGDETVTVGISCPQGRFTDPVVTLPNGTKQPAQFTQIAYDDSFEVKFGGVSYAGAVLQDGTQLTVLAQGLRAELTYLDPLGFEDGDQADAGGLHAPMPGKVVAVRVQLGDSVKKGQALVIVEAMKMEHTIIAPADGIVAAIHANIGEQVDEKRELIALE